MSSNASKSNKSLLKDKEARKLRRDFADRLDKLIKENKTTADAVAKKTGIAKGTLSNYINATTSPKALEIKKIAECLPTTCDYLLRGVKTENVSIHEKTGLSDKAIEVLKNKAHPDLKIENLNGKVISHLSESDPCYQELMKAGFIGPQNDFIKTVNTLLINKKVLELISDYLFAEFQNEDNPKQPYAFTVKRKDTNTINWIKVSEIMEAYLIKIQSELLELKKSFMKEGK